MIATSTTAITLSEAATFIAQTTGCRRPHVNTILRWAMKGVRGVRMHSVRVGRTHWTTHAAVTQFLAQLNATDNATSHVAAEVLATQRLEHARRVHEQLAAELGIEGEAVGG